MEVVFKCLTLFVVIGVTLATSEPNGYAPVIVSTYRNSREIPLFKGKIREDETTVRLDPPLSAYDNDTVGSARLICRYEIVSHRKTVPFIIELVNRETGEANIKLKEGAKIDYASTKRKHYKFNIFAYDCYDEPYSKRSNRAVVTVKVEAADKYAPVIENSPYFVTMEEGKIYESLVKLSTKDNDESEENKAICGFEILTPEVPFTIDKEGNLKNTAVVSASERYNFILKVVARDCGGIVSKPAYINIKIKETCKNGWKGFPEHIEYIPGSGPKAVSSNAELNICDEECKPDHIAVRFELSTKHIGKGCDRDTYSVQSQRKLCGAGEGSIDLLPPPTLTSNWTNSLPTDDGHEGDKIYAFNGLDNAVVVPDGHVDHRLNKHFTISTWMKHAFPNTVVTKHKNGNKEHILCMSDGDGMNRHHYAWLVHNTKLIFILRQESYQADDMEVFKPAEWRWNLKEVNDGQWHHYAISVDFPEVRLYVDGQEIEGDKDNFEILDDWPLHASDRVHFTKLVVGACWRGLEEKFADHFQGYLAGLSLLKDKIESERVIQCMNNCQENMDFIDLSDMPSETSVSFNKDKTEVSITGTNATDIVELVRQVAYENFRTFPTPGRRNLNIRTSVHCGNLEEILPQVDTYVFVEHSNKPVITVTGQKMIAATVKEYNTSGVKIFKDLSVHVDLFPLTNIVDDVDDSESDSKEEEITNETTDKKHARLDYKLSKASLLQKGMLENRHEVLLDMCTIRAEPVLDFYVEHLDLPKDIIKELNMKLEGIETAAGLVILNADTVSNYLKVIQNILYTHTEAADFYMRKFIVSCSSQSGRFVSNEFEMSILKREIDMAEPKVVPIAHVRQDTMSAQSLLQPQFQKGFQRGSFGTHFGMVAIIVVCVGFLLFMIILGVFRIRATHRRRVVQVDAGQEMEWDNSELNITVNPIDQEVDAGQEMEWDNSELNITVNPIDQELFEYEDNPKKRSLLPDDSDTDDDISECFHDEGDTTDDEDEIEGETGKKTLEWDDSTLSY